MSHSPLNNGEPKPPAATQEQAEQTGKGGKPKETGGPKGPEPTRYGDWEIGGKCVDF